MSITMVKIASKVYSAEAHIDEHQHPGVRELRYYIDVRISPAITVTEDLYEAFFPELETILGGHRVSTKNATLLSFKSDDQWEDEPLQTYLENALKKLVSFLDGIEAADWSKIIF